MREISREESKDAGLALVLIALVVVYKSNNPKLVILPGILLLLCILAPGFFRYFGRLWFGAAHLLGLVMSKVVLTLIFFFVVTPVGLLMRAMGKDFLKVRLWKQGSASVFRKSERKITAADLENPY